MSLEKKWLFAATQLRNIAQLGQRQVSERAGGETAYKRIFNLEDLLRDLSTTNRDHKGTHFRVSESQGNKQNEANQIFIQTSSSKTLLEGTRPLIEIP